MTRRSRSLVVGVAVTLVFATWLAKRPTRDAPRRPADLVRAPRGVESQRSAPTAHASSRQLTGRVVRAGAPVANARVVATSILIEAARLAPPTAVSDAHGRFTLDALPAEQLSVSASANGATSAVARVDLRTSPAADIELEIADCAAAIFGVVGDASRNGLSHARVRRVIGSRPEPEGALTSADGRYELCVPPGPQVVRVDAAGYGSLLRAIDAAGRSEQDFALAPEAVVAGQVTRGSNGAPAGGLLVWSFSVDRGTQAGAASTAVSDQDGRFRLTGIEAGKIGIRAFGEGFTYREAPPLVVEPGQTIENHAVVVDDASVVEGVVVADSGPVANARVSVRRGEVVSRAAQTASDGHFVLSLAPPGELVFSVDGFEVESPATFVNDGANRRPVTLRVKRKSAVRGQVLLDGQPAAGATVYAAAPSVDAPPIKTDAQGRFTFNGLAAATYRLAAETSTPPAQSELVSVAVGADDPPKPVTLLLRRRSQIRGRVVDSSHEPVSRAFVAFHKADGEEELSTISDADGRFSMVGFSGGEYLGRVKDGPAAPEWLPLAGGGTFVRVAVRAGESSGEVQLVTAARGGPISGRVVGRRDGQPLADVVVTARRGTDGPAWAATASQVRTDLDGNFSFGRLPPGAYVVTASGARAGEGRVDDIHPGARDVLVRIEASGQIAGELRGFGGPTVVRAHASGGRVYAANSDGGSFLLDGVSPGTYRVEAGDWPNVSQATATVAARGTARVVLARTAPARVHGHVRDLARGGPVADVQCFVIDGAAGEERSQPGSSFAPAADGSFAIDAPAGAVDIGCVGDLTSVADGRSRIVGDEDATVWVATRRAPQRPFVRLGAAFEDASAGLRVVAARPGGAAARAGLAAGDVIVAADGRSLESLARRTKLWFLLDRDPGAPLSVVVQRDGGTRTMQLTPDVL